MTDASHLFQAALLLVAFVSGGFEGLHAAPHVPLKHLPVLALLLPQRHEVTTVVGLILNIEDTSLSLTHSNTFHFPVRPAPLS